MPYGKSYILGLMKKYKVLQNNDLFNFDLKFFEIYFDKKRYNLVDGIT